LVPKSVTLNDPEPQIVGNFTEGSELNLVFGDISVNIFASDFP